ncbi:MAG TPA: RIP metalloprotease RseP [Candidatus Moranbacteria bacterium]|nr:RIP metalloprotease RseP [Candidatus Moranbacteria bacterium]
MFVVIFIVILGVLIFVHELGHFVMARRNGIRAYEFGFGFPPRIFGIQLLDGKKRRKVEESETMEIEISDIKKKDGTEMIKETIVDKITEVDEITPVKKWRFIWGNKDGDNAEEKKDLAEAHKDHLAGGTIYSINWIPIGGFVKIKGEDGGHKGDEDSFSTKNAWIRTKVLVAGVAMNFILAWFLISLGFMIGAPESIDPDKNVENSRIQISEVIVGSPAELMGIKIGDEISKKQINPLGEKVNLKNITEVQNYISSQKGKALSLELIRGKEILKLTGTPRADAPEGQGPLGVSLTQTLIVSYPWYEAIFKGLVTTFDLIIAILVAFGGLLKGLFSGAGVGAEVAGPIGIAVLTREVANLGLIYLIQFTALLSINLGIINALPIPALDGGRIFFIIIEKIKGRPVSQKVEQAFHTAFFLLLIMLMIVITFKDVTKFIK